MKALILSLILVILIILAAVIGLALRVSRLKGELREAETSYDLCKANAQRAQARLTAEAIALGVSLDALEASRTRYREALKRSDAIRKKQAAELAELRKGAEMP